MRKSSLKRALVHVLAEGGFLLLASTVGGLVFARAHLPPPPAFVAPRPPETKDRLTPEQMEAMVAGPVALLRQGKAAEADAAARRLVGAAQARGDSVRAADLLTAYGVQRFSDATAHGGPEDRRGAIAWFREAVAAARRAWGPDHPETALALNDLGDVLRQIAPDPPGEEAEQALRQAYAIRLKTLGPRNPETLAAGRALADVLSAGPPAARLRTGTDAEIRKLYRDAAEGQESRGAAVPAPERLGPWMGLALAEARSGRPAEALADYERARRALLLDAPKGPPDFLGCATFAEARRHLAEIFKARGEAEAAERVGGRTQGDPLSDCLDGKP